ncbi:DctP family TRAP transporter solute-binding subunit [Halomonas sp. AOP43-D1-4]|uniref:DctP family TRAP transporter solute-binding subunit n=1 Tax=Halomonas sp. AOP43-D1-4 TaxID=3457658 RepID=UPI004034D953
MKRHAFLKTVWATSAASLLFASAASAETLRLSHNTGDTTTWHEAAELFNDLLNEASEGELSVRTFPNSQLAGGDQMRQFEMVGRGAIDLVMTSAINVTPLIPEMAVFSLPYLYDGYDQVDATMNGEPVKLLEEIMDEKGVKVLAWGESGFRELTNSKRPIRSPDDMRGLNMRVAGPMYVDVMDALGANPQQMQWVETISALQQGVVDGQENGIGAVIIPQRIYEVQDYITLWHYSYDPIFLGISKQRWESFDAETQEMVQQAADQAMAHQLAITRENTAEGVNLLREQGMDITELTPEEIEVFRQATAPAFDIWAERVGPDIVSSFVETIESSKQQ